MVISWVLALSGGIALSETAASAGSPSPKYTVTVGTPVNHPFGDDTPMGSYIDKDGAFYGQTSLSYYPQGWERRWNFHTGTNFDDLNYSNGISQEADPAKPADKNSDTTWRCNNGPTGKEATKTSPVDPKNADQGNYCTLIGVWVDADTGDWYGLVHNEFTISPFKTGLHYDGIDYAVSKDQGKTWSIKDHVITSPYSTKRGDTTAFPKDTYSYGDGDPRLYVDTASGYFYVYYGSRVVDKSGGWRAFYGHVARAPISDKMARPSWRKWYGGTWTEPGTGGKESNMVPVDASNTTGYTPVAKEYSPANSGNASAQIAAGKMPDTSPLFVMDITYNAYLGLYIGEPQNVDQSGNAPQQYYATDNLATQQWRLLGDTGNYHTRSWYRWFVDNVSKTSSTIVGKDFRSYCTGCKDGVNNNYVQVTVGSSDPAAAPFDPAKTYRIGNGNGRTLAQVPGGQTATSLTAATGSDREGWSFTANGDGSYRIANASTGQLLGVASTSTATRKWGTVPTVTGKPTTGPTTGQQWWIIPTTSSSGTKTGTYRLVNRYSGLALGMTSASDRLAETTPARSWTSTVLNSVGAGRTAEQQELTVTAVGTSPEGSLNGIHFLATKGNVLNSPGHSTTAGTQLITYPRYNGLNEQWQFTQQSDGSYEIVNIESKLCVDISGNSTSAGAKVIQNTCNKQAGQRWILTRLTTGAYTVASAKTRLLLTTTPSPNNWQVTQETNNNSLIQQWTIS
ncbi:RICIN domain-containing protein [Streptomyces sp. NBC_00435]|uniref:RICIN domain-containing protein n=1 Tax=Streptomyces sp. NBC_00435 TaxID=2903649 RepID=UPI002E1BDF5F